MRMNGIRRLAICAVLGLAAWMLGPPLAAAEPRCPCRYAGQYYAQGECVCMANSAGVRLACCGRVLNNSSWSFVAGGCKVATGAPTMQPRALSTPDDAGNRPGAAGPAIQQAKLPE
jgi:hypothetical protein